MAFGVLVAALSCHRGRATLEGQVVDLSGNPVRAEVSIVGQAVSVRTDSSGHYRLPYVPGRFLVRYSSSQSLPLEVPWDLYEAAQVEAAPVTMVRRPPSAGLFTVEGGEYRGVPLSPLRIEQASVLGLASSRRPRLKVEGEGVSVCAEEPLVYKDSSGTTAQALSAYRLTSGSAYLDDEHGGSSYVVIDPVEVGEGVLVLRAGGREKEPNGSDEKIAIVASRAPSTGLEQGVYLIRVKSCQEGR